MKNKSVQILSDVTVYTKYAKYIPELKRRETWNEIVDRNLSMHLKKFKDYDSDFIDEIKQAYELVREKKILPSMRSMQFAGKPIEVNPARLYNCCYLPIDNYIAFSETMFLLLSGVGVGFSVQKHHVEQLPEIIRPLKNRRFLVADSIEGWADAIKYLFKSYFTGSPEPRYDFSDIRQKGANLITSGGKAPGPEPLKSCIHNIKTILDRKSNGEKLSSLEVHDIVCHIADCVLSGGIRRSACISLFSFDDEEMLTCKFGNWWELNPQRARSNNSTVILRHRITKTDFFELWKKIEASNSGEPGIYFTNNMEIGVNPCAEISLRPFQFCNLVEINISNIESQSDFEERVRAVTLIATLQASYTDFHYLRDMWKKNTEKDALIGVGMTGIASGVINKLDISSAAKLVKKENSRIAKIIGINKAARTTTTKPSGTSSLVLGCSSGVHPWHSEFYKRRLTVGKNEAIYTYFKQNNPDLVEDDILKPNTEAKIVIPIKAPENASFRDEDVFDMLERVKFVNEKWVHIGHRNGDNFNNVSATISIKNDEWESVGKWMWENRNSFNGLSVLPFDYGSYKQAPFEDITEEEYNKLCSEMKDIDFSKILEEDDNTNLIGEAACAGNQCEIV